VRLWNPFGLRELNALWKDPVFRGRGVPPGDGRSVLLVPGFLSGDWSLRLLHGWLERIGYRSYLSGIYVNAFHSEHMLAGLRHRLAEILKDDDAPITLIGHSRGGLLAKVLSQRRPKDVEQVITLGSPLADVTDLALMTRAAVGVVTTEFGTVRGQINDAALKSGDPASVVIPSEAIDVFPAGTDAAPNGADDTRAAYRGNEIAGAVLASDVVAHTIYLTLRLPGGHDLNIESHVQKYDRALTQGQGAVSICWLPEAATIIRQGA